MESKIVQNQYFTHFLYMVNRNTILKLKMYFVAGSLMDYARGTHCSFSSNWGSTFLLYTLRKLGFLCNQADYAKSDSHQIVARGMTSFTNNIERDSVLSSHFL